MTGKVQKIKDWISKEQDVLMDANGNFENPSEEGAFHILSNLDYYIDFLQKEPVSEDLEEAVNAYIGYAPEVDESSSVYGKRQAFKAGSKWQKEKDESTTEDLGEYINELSKQFPEVSFAKLSRIAVRVAKWKKQHLWKPADGDDLPDIDREVIALLDNGKVVFAHRPNPDGWDGKSLSTGKVEHYTPKTYGKGGWNIPDIMWWLDIELPKGIEL